MKTVEMMQVRDMIVGIVRGTTIDESKWVRDYTYLLLNGHKETLEAVKVAFEESKK